MNSIFYGFISKLKDGVTRAIRVKSEATVINDSESPIPSKIEKSVDLTISEIKKAIEIGNLSSLESKASDVVKGIQGVDVTLEKRLNGLENKLDSILNSLEQKYYCLSEEEKPLSKIKDGSSLLEIDTKKKFLFYKGEWHEV